MSRELEKSLRTRLEGKEPERPGQPKTRERRVSDVVAKMSPELREAVYDEIVRRGWEDY